MVIPGTGQPGVAYQRVPVAWTESSGLAMREGPPRGRGRSVGVLSCSVTRSFQTQLFFTISSEFVKNADSLLVLLKF